MSAVEAVQTVDEAALRQLAATMARAALGLSGQVWLHGPLGAGKSTFCRAWIQALMPGARVKSPTFSLVEPYATEPLPLYHLDLYRIADPEELEFLGLREWLGHGQLLIEWPEKGAGFLPPPDLEIWLEHARDQRRLRMAAHTAPWQRHLSAFLSP